MCGCTHARGAIGVLLAAGSAYTCQVPMVPASTTVVVGVYNIKIQLTRRCKQLKF